MEESYEFLVGTPPPLSFSDIRGYRNSRPANLRRQAISLFPRKGSGQSVGLLDKIHSLLPCDEVPVVHKTIVARVFGQFFDWGRGLDTQILQAVRKNCDAVRDRRAKLAIVLSSF